MLALVSALLALASSPLHRVVVTGGTHGNEYTGVYLLDRLAMPEQQAALKRAYPSLAVETVLANPVAHKENRRFMDTDLNRMFSSEALSDESILGYEARRAKELALGCLRDAALNIDLHTTTSNMGCTLIVNTWSALTIRAAAYVAERWAAEPAPPAGVPLAPLYVMLHDGGTQESSPHVCSAARDGLEIECGPTPQGLVRADVVATTERALRLLLEYFELCVSGRPPEPPETLEVFFDLGKVSFLEFEGGVRESSALPSGLVAPSLQDGDFQPLQTGEPMFVTLGGETVPYDGRYGDMVYPVFVNEVGHGLGTRCKPILRACADSCVCFTFLYAGGILLSSEWARHRVDTQNALAGPQTMMNEEWLLPKRRMPMARKLRLVASFSFRVTVRYASGNHNADP